MKLQRRTFLAGSLALGAAAGSALRGLPAWADDLPGDQIIERVVSFTLPSRRVKIAGRNAGLDVHGQHAADRMLRIYTRGGATGLGACHASEEQAAALVGQSPAALFAVDVPAALTLGGLGTGPLWDLMGQLFEQPIYELLGGQGPQQVRVYDGSIYFADLLPEYENRWQDRFRQEIDDGLARGHRAFKIKVGRGHRWMERAAGNQRDIEVVRLIREHAGPEITLGVDANNGYDLPGAKEFLAATAECQLAFAEEMFPETVEDCLALKEFLAANEMATLVADGETQGDLEAYRPLIEAQAVDVLQGDMKHYGFEGILQEANWCGQQGLQVAPHNWGSLIGYYMQLHMGRAIENFYMAENDPLECGMLVAEGYAIEDGLATVPDSPGLGLALDEAAFARDAEIHYDLRA